MKKIIFAIMFFHLFAAANVQASKLDDIDSGSMDPCREVMIECQKFQCRKFKNVDINDVEGVARLWKARDMIRSVNEEYILETDKYIENEWDDFFDIPTDPEFLRYLDDLDRDGLLKQRRWFQLLERKQNCEEGIPEYREDRDVFDREFAFLTVEFQTELKEEEGNPVDLRAELPKTYPMPKCSDAFGPACSQSEIDQASLVRFAAFVLEKKKFCEFLENP